MYKCLDCRKYTNSLVCDECEFIKRFTGAITCVVCRRAQAYYLFIEGADVCHSCQTQVCDWCGARESILDNYGKICSGCYNSLIYRCVTCGVQGHPRGFCGKFCSSCFDKK